VTRRTARAEPGYGAVVDLLARLTVLGSLNMDISVTVPALPGPGATVLGGAASFDPGGKGANQAVAAARLAAAAGIGVRMVGCVGDDDFGRTLKAALSQEGVDDRAVRIVPGAPTGIAMITVDQAGENMITVAPGANGEVGPQEIAALGGADQRDVLVISAEVPLAAVLAALGAGPLATGTPQAARPLTVLNLAPAPQGAEAASVLGARPDWLIVNESEAAAVLGRPVSGLTEAARAAADLVAAGARNAVVTAGSAGAAYHAAHGKGEDNNPVEGTVPAFPIHARDTVGAGDTFVGALAVALAAGIGPEEAVTAASAAAATAASRPGTQEGMPHPGDIRVATGYEWPLSVAK
jgi:ribokinase